MKKYLRCVNEGLDITVGNRYEIVDTENYGGCQCYVILDDRGDEHLYPVEVDEEGESYRNWFVLETEGGESMENVIEIDGVKYREVKRKAAVGEKIKTTRVGGAYTPIPIGEILVVTYVFNDGSGVDTENWPYEHEEYVVLEPITEYPRVDIDAERELVDLIALQRELNGLKRQQAELTKQVDGLTDAFAKLAAKTVVPKPKTAQPEAKSRDEIVAQAKRDVAELPTKDYYETASLPGWSGLYIGGRDTVDFFVNREKRTVVAVLKYDGRIFARGIAKAAPGDVFNVYIGKAIALRRALGLPVPTEYTNAPQPEGFRIGDVITFPTDDSDGWYGKVTYKITSLRGGANLRITKDVTGTGTFGVGDIAHGGNFTWSVLYDDSGRYESEVSS